MATTTLSHKRLWNRRVLLHSLILTGLTLASLLVHRSALQIGFIADDFSFLTIDIQRIFSMSGNIYRPFGITLFFLANQWFGDNAATVLHILGIALHVINSYLLFRLAEALTNNIAISLFAAVVSLYNLNAIEPVYWLSALIFYLPLATLFLLTLLLAYHKFKSILVENRSADANPNWYLRVGIQIALLWLCNLMFHEAALVTPLIVGLMFYGGVFFPRPKFNLLRHFFLWLPSMLVAVAYGIIRIALHAPIIGPENRTTC